MGWMLHGPEIWYYENGKKQYEVTYKLGRKVGTETHWAADGTKKWQWSHNDDGTSVWRQWWPAPIHQNEKAESTWRDFKCHGTAKRWDSSGKLISQKTFVDGQMVE